MRLVLFADIHSNREAFTACRAHAAARGADAYAVLGDVVGYGADPEWAVEQVAEMVADGALAVLGNHDEAALCGPGPRMNPDAAAAIQWTRQRLRPEHLAFLASLPLQAERDGVLLVHANASTPKSWDYVTGAGEADRSLAATPCRRILCGHVHQQALYPAGEGGPIPIAPGVAMALGTRRWLAIAGSVGQPRDGNPAACYACWDDDAATLTFHRVAYDHATAAAKIAAAGLPPRLAERLHWGV